MAYETGILAASEDRIFEGIVQRELEENRGKTVKHITGEVVKTTRKYAEVLNESGSDDLGRELEQQGREYDREKNAVLHSDFKIDDLTSQNAIGITDMSDRSVTASDEFMAAGSIDEEKAEGMRDHELVHRNDQAAHFDADEVHLYDKEANTFRTFTITGTGEDAGDGVEGQASQKNRNEHLIPAYVDAKNNWKDMERITGKAPLEEAMRTGRMRDFQRDQFKRVFGNLPQQ